MCVLGGGRASTTAVGGGAEVMHDGPGNARSETMALAAGAWGTPSPCQPLPAPPRRGGGGAPRAPCLLRVHGTAPPRVSRGGAYSVSWRP